MTLAIVSSAAMIAGIATTVQNREESRFLLENYTSCLCSHIAANAQIEQDLHASSSDVSWSMSLFILVQGLFPLVWSAISEIQGRKVCSLCVQQLHHSKIGPGCLLIINVAVYYWLGRRKCLKVHRSGHSHACRTSSRASMRFYGYPVPLMTCYACSVRVLS